MQRNLQGDSLIINQSNIPNDIFKPKINNLKDISVFWFGLDYSFFIFMFLLILLSISIPYIFFIKLELNFSLKNRTC